MASVEVLLAFLGTFALLALCGWLWRLANAKPRPPRGRDREEDTKFISKEETLHGQVELAGKLDLPQGEFTAIVSSRESFLAADRARASERSTKIIPRPAFEPTKAAPTEYIPHEEILAMARRAVAPAEPSPVPEHAPPPEIPTEILAETFESAVARSHELTTDDPRDLAALVVHERAWLADLEILSLNGGRAAQHILLPALLDEQSSDQRRLAAVLALLRLRGVEGPQLLLELDRNVVTPELLTKALGSWADPRAEVIATSCFWTAGERERLKWLEVFEARTADPGPEIVRELLGSSDPEQLAAGLRLLPLHGERDEHVAVVERNSSFGPPIVRKQAIVAGLVLRRPTAWMTCKQAARVAESSNLRLLLATFGSDDEIANLIAWAEKAAAPNDTWWALGLSGRKSGIVACLDRMQHADAGGREVALAGFRAATGASSTNVEAARAWWVANESRFASNVRYLGGLGLTPATLAAVLRSAGYDLRAAIGLELMVRSRGQLRLATREMPERALALADRVAEFDLNLQKSYSSLQ